MVWICLFVLFLPVLIPVWIIKGLCSVNWKPYEPEEEIEITCTIDEKEMRRQRAIEKRKAIAQTTIDYYEPERGRIKAAIKKAEHDKRLADEAGIADHTHADNRLAKLRKQLYDVEVKLQKAYFDMED